MKVTKLVTNPIHAGNLYILEDVTELEDFSEADEKSLREYEKQGFVKLETPKKAPAKKAVPAKTEE